jgi:hypothetical protein
LQRGPKCENKLDHLAFIFQVIIIEAYGKASEPHPGRTSKMLPPGNLTARQFV